MRKSPKCKPSVYLEAAKLIANKNEFFSCSAIENAIYGRRALYTEHFLTQYAAMFGPYNNPEILIDDTNWPRIPSKKFSKKYYREHPFWNKFANDERKECRILALLFMYEICRNP